MPAYSLPLRSQVQKEHTWNAESVFPTLQAWEAEVDSIFADLPRLKKFQSRLGEGAGVLVDALQIYEDLNARTQRVVVYAGFTFSVDTTDATAAGLNSRANTLVGQLGAAGAFIYPELIELGETRLMQWLREEPGLAHYGQFMQNLFRRRSHVRSSEVEEVLGMLADPFSGPRTASSLLTNADMKVEPGAASDGEPIEINDAILHQVMNTGDRQARRTTWENYHAALLSHKNTLSTNLITSIKQNVFLSRVRRHETALEMMLSENNIPVAVFHNLLEAFKKNLPIWHRYFEVRRKLLGIDVLEPYDMWAPLTGRTVEVPYEKAVNLISEGLLPLGREYVGILRNGCLEERWVDVYPNKGKRSGAFSWGSPGTHPFIMMSYTGDVVSLSTLAHELGHSMHSYLTWQNQPFVYADYSLFAAEVASNFHQALVRAHLLSSNLGREFEIAVIEEAMSNFYRYFFIMPTLARFELETHTAIENNQPLTAGSLSNLMSDLFAEGFGGKVNVRREHVGMTWARFGHLYSDYYVYAYSTGIAGAHALAGRVLRQEPNAVENYLGFLKAGCSDYPLDVLQRAGVDLTTPAPVEAAFAVMSSYVDRLETLLA